MEKMDHLLLMHKFLSGEISDEENAQFKLWLAAEPRNREQFEEIKFIWDSADFGEAELEDDPEEELRKLQERIDRAATVNRRVGLKKRLSKSRKSTFLKIAAVALLLMSFNLLAWYMTRNPGGEQIEIVNQGHYNEITLPDGSKAYLNRNASLSFEGHKGKREAYLKGEAYFEVIKDQSRPFFVHLPNATINVLGTSFNVNVNPDNDSTIVTVTSGTVAFFNTSNSIMVGSGEKASMSNNSEQITKKVNTDPNFDAWKTGKLEFKNTELSKILVVLQDYYGISFKTTDDNILNCRFTGTFKNDRLEKVLQVLSFGLNFKYHFDERHYILSGEGCKKNN